MTNDDQPFTPLFQREMLVLLLQDPTAYGKFRDVWRASYWDDVTHRKIVEAFINARAGAREHPTKTTIIQELLNGIENVRGILPMDKVAQLEEMEVLYNAPLPSPGNGDYSLKRVATFAKTQALVAALGQMIGCARVWDPEGAKSIFNNARRVGDLNEEDGLEYAGDLANATIDETQNILGNRLLERGTFGTVCCTQWRREERPDGPGGRFTGGGSSYTRDRSSTSLEGPGGAGGGLPQRPRRSDALSACFSDRCGGAQNGGQ